MTRKKSRPQHNVSPKKTNEGGFYKVFWDSMEGEENSETEEMLSPGDISVKSPPFIIINDSDDENPLTIDENSGDQARIPFPIKEEFQLSVSEKSDLSHSDRLQCDKSNEDGVVPALQPTLEQQNPSAPLAERTTSPIVRSINSPVHSLDETSTLLCENVVQSSDASDVLTTVPSSEQSDYINSELSELPVNISEHVNTSNEEVIPNEPCPAQQNGGPSDVVAECSQVCASDSSQDHQIEQPNEISNNMSLSCNHFLRETCSDNFESTPIVRSEQNYDIVPPTSTENTGLGALSLLKSLLLSDGNSNSILNVNSDNENMDNANNSSVMAPVQIKRERFESQSVSSVNVPSPRGTNCSNSSNSLDHLIREGSLNDNIPTQAISSPISEPRSCSVVDDSFPNPPKSQIHNHSNIDEFPTYKHFLLRKLKVEPNRIFRSLELLKSELLILYTDNHVKNAFHHELDENEVAGVETMERDKFQERVPTLDTAPCRVMMERLPTPMVVKGCIATTGKRFQSWKSRIVRQRNEEKFRHLKVWRRGRTLLWRECELAGMDKNTYDEQVAYIKKHKVSETSSSESESSDNDDNQSVASEDHAEVLGDTLEDGSDSDASDESETSDVGSDELSSSPATTPSKAVKFIRSNTHASLSNDSMTSGVNENELRNFSKGGPKPKRYTEDSSSEQTESESPAKSISISRDEYVVERNTVNDELNSDGKKRNALKITIRKTSVSKSEDEREKSVESEVESTNNFTIPTKRPCKKVKRTFVTKRTYRKPEDIGNSTPSIPPKPNTSQKSSPPETARKRKMYSEDDNEEESLLGRRAYEVENDNLLEKWEIPFEAPTLFRSPRVASRLAQMRNKEAFRPQIRHSKVQKTAPINKEIKDVVEMLCTKTVEAMLSPDIINVSSCPDHKNSKSDEAPHHEEFLKPQKVVDDIPLPQTKPTVQNDEPLSTKPLDEEDFSDQSSIVPDDEESSAVDESSKHDESLDKGTSEEQAIGVNQSPKVTRAKRKRYGYKKRKSKVKPNVHANDTLKVDEKGNTDQTNELNTIKLPKVIVSPLHSTQVPVVSEGPGQSPQESEDDSLLNKVSTIPEKETNEFDASLRENDDNRNSSLSLKECSVLIPDVTNEPAAHNQQPDDQEDVILPRVTRSKQPTITLDPDVLENFGVRKKRKSEVTHDKTESAGKPLPIANQKPAPKPAPKSRKPKGKTSVNTEQEDILKTGTLTMDTSDSDSLNTQVHEVSEGPGEVVLEPEEQQKTSQDSSNDNDMIDSELANIEAIKGEAVRQSQIIPDSPMSPTPDAEAVSVMRVTRSKKKMMPPSRYITVPSEPSVEVELATQVGGSKLMTDRETVACNSQLMSKSVAEENEISPNINQEVDVAKSVAQCQLESGVKYNNASKPSLKLLQSNKVLEDLTPGESCDVPMNAVPCTSVETNFESSAELLDNQAHNLIPIQEITTKVAKENVSEFLESPVNSSAGPTTSTVEENSDNVDDLDENSKDSGSTESNTSRERLAVLDALNSILAVGSKTKKHVKSCPPFQTDANIPALLQSIIPLISIPKINIPAQSKDDDVTAQSAESKNDDVAPSKNDSLGTQSINSTNNHLAVNSSKSKNDGSGSDGGGDLVVDDDFSDDDNHSSELEDRINKIIQDQMINDDQLIQPEVEGKPHATESVIDKTAGSKCEVVCRSKEELDKPKNDGVSPHLDKTSSTQKQTSASEEKSSLDQIKASEAVVNSKDTPFAKRRDSIDEKTGLPNNLIQKLRDPRIRNKLLSHFEGDDVSDKKSSVTNTSINVLTEHTKAPVNEPQAVTRDPRALRLAVSDPRKKVETPVEGILKIPLDQTTAVTPVRVGSASETLVTPKSPLLPSPVLPSPISSGSNLSKPVLDAPPNTIPVTSDSIEVSDDDEESIKRRPKKSKKEIDTELMYRSPLEDLQTESRPSYRRNWKPPHPRRFSNNDPRRRDSSDGRNSRWDVKCNPKQSHPDIPQQPELQRSYNNDHWAMPQVNPSCTPMQNVNPAWNPNWFPNFNPMVYREPRMNYMETQLFNLALLPKTTNLKTPPLKKIYTFFDHGNPQVLRIAPPTHDPNEESRTITMMDAMGQEMIDIVQLPRPTSGLTEDYFAELPCDCTLEDLVAKPYLPLSVFAAYEEVDGKEFFADSDEESDSRSNKKKHVVAEKSKQQLAAPLSEIEGKKTECSISSVNDNDPLKNILNCLPQLKEQYSFSKNPPTSIANDPFDLGKVLTDNNGSVVTPPPPPVWTTSDVDLRPKGNQLGKSSSQKEDKLPVKNWRNPSPPKISKSKYTRRSRSKSPARRRRKSRSRSPDRWRRSRSPYSRSPSRRSRSRSPGRRCSWNRDYSRSRSRDRSRSPQRSRRYRSRSRSPPSYKRSTSISPSRKHSRR